MQARGGCRGGRLRFVHSKSGAAQAHAPASASATCPARARGNSCSLPGRTSTTPTSSTSSVRATRPTASSSSGLRSSLPSARRPQRASTPTAERLHDAFPGATLVRLRRLKARYDPNNVFNPNFPIRRAAERSPAGPGTRALDGVSLSAYQVAANVPGGSGGRSRTTGSVYVCWATGGRGVTTGSSRECWVGVRCAEPQRSRPAPMQGSRRPAVTEKCAPWCGQHRPGVRDVAASVDRAYACDQTRPGSCAS
jgi:hypothetical protein